MLSRVADSIYWMCRYVERVENLARFTDVTFNLMLDLPAANAPQWMPLVFITGDYDLFAGKYGAATQENVLRFLTFDRDYPHSILSCLGYARDNARSVRETISSEMWEHLNQFYYTVRDAAKNPDVLRSPHDFFQQVKMFTHLFKGVTDGTMSHNEGWHFARLGRLLERADKTSRMLDVKYFALVPLADEVGSPADDLQWSAVLRSVSGFEMYRRQYHGVSPRRVVQFLLLDPYFPRAIQYCVISADTSLHAISGTPQVTAQNLAEQRLGKLRAEMAYAKVEDILAGGLHEFIDTLQTKLNGIGAAIHETFIAVRPVETAFATSEAAPTQRQSQSQSSGSASLSAAALQS